MVERVISVRVKLGEKKQNENEYPSRTEWINCYMHSVKYHSTTKTHNNLDRPQGVTLSRKKANLKRKEITLFT